MKRASPAPKLYARAIWNDTCRVRTCRGLDQALGSCHTRRAACCLAIQLVQRVQHGWACIPSRSHPLPNAHASGALRERACTDRPWGPESFMHVWMHACSCFAVSHRPDAHSSLSSLAQVRVSMWSLACNAGSSLAVKASGRSTRYPSPHGTMHASHTRRRRKRRLVSFFTTALIVSSPAKTCKHTMEARIHVCVRGRCIRGSLCEQAPAYMRAANISACMQAHRTRDNNGVHGCVSAEPADQLDVVQP